jgi:hypothetical protein
MILSQLNMALGETEKYVKNLGRIWEGFVKNLGRICEEFAESSNG